MEYTENQLTEWFDVETQKPWEHGVYEIKYDNGLFAASYFNGDFFMNGYTESLDLVDRVNFAYFDNNRMETSVLKAVQWRGLNFNPNAPTKPAKKKGNKRKTLYVVFESNYAKTKKVCVGCYSVKKNAQIKSESVPYGFIQEVRFRTPEA